MSGEERENINFVTLFDANFIHQGIALYESLGKYTRNFKLYVCCFDKETEEIFSGMRGIKTFSIESLENIYPDLLDVKSDRKIGEYCWTSTPFVLKYCLEIEKLENCTYLDADICFFSSPEMILNQMPKSSNVIITRHNYSQKYAYLEKQSGIYCVQFMYFNQEASSLELLNIWANQCIDWCFGYFDEKNNRFGDQKYLDFWHERPNVHIVKDVSYCSGPWNIENIAKNGNIEKIVFHHFHDIKISDRKFDIMRLLNYEKSLKYIFLYIKYINYLYKINSNLKNNGVKSIVVSKITVYIVLFAGKPYLAMKNNIKCLVKKFLKS